MIFFRTYLGSKYIREFFGVEENAFSLGKL